MLLEHWYLVGKWMIASFVGNMQGEAVQVHMYKAI